MHFFSFIALLFLVFAGCVDSGYHPSYIISDKSHEEYAEQSEESVKLF
jgi:hypothetical protein